MAARSSSGRSWSEELYRLGFFLVAIIFSVFLQQGKLDATIRDTVLLVQQPARTIAQEADVFRTELSRSWQVLRFGGSRLAQVEQELSVLQAQHERLAQLERENQLLRQELGRVQGKDINVYRFFGNGSEWFIDGGEIHGVKPGQSVQREGALVGVVSETYPHFSRVKTLFDKEWRVPVQVGTESARPRGVYDQSSGIGQVRFIPLALQVEEGQPVFTLGDAEVPAQLLLGWIQRVQPGEDQATWKIDLRIAFPPDRVEWVEIDQQEDGSLSLFRKPLAESSGQV
jgi:cell shape-determining protein MreC